jgi:hypothetical protein
MLVDSIFLLYTFVQEKIYKIRYVESYVSSIAVMPDIMDIYTVCIVTTIMLPLYIINLTSLFHYNYI